MSPSSRAARQPIRTCVGCGAKKSQRQMLRIAAHAGDDPTVDVEYCAPGRGAYLCRTKSCLERAFARRALERALKLKTGISDRLQTELDKQLI